VAVDYRARALTGPSRSPGAGVTTGRAASGNRRKGEVRVPLGHCTRFPREVVRRCGGPTSSSSNREVCGYLPRMHGREGREKKKTTHET